MNYCAINLVISDLAYNVAWGAFYLIKGNITVTCPQNNNFSLCTTVTRAKANICRTLNRLQQQKYSN